jgi:hypothetical protein
VDGFATFDPDEKDHVVEDVNCDVVIKDAIGNIVAEVEPWIPS